MHFQFLIIIEPFFIQVETWCLIYNRGLFQTNKIAEWYLILHFYQVISLRRSVANVNMKRDPRTSFYKKLLFFWFCVLCCIVLRLKHSHSCNVEKEILPYLHRDYNKTFIQNFVLEIIITIQAVWMYRIHLLFNSVYFILFFIISWTARY